MLYLQGVKNKQTTIIMKKLIFLILVLIFFFGCDKKSRTKSEQAELDRKIDSIVDQTMKSTIEGSILDSTGMETSPIIVLKSKIVEKEYSNYRDLYLKYKNISNKTIEGIKFEWYGVDVFGKPADMDNSYISGRGGGFSDEKINPNQSNDGTYSILSRDAKKIKMIRAYEVVFSDGTFWKLEDYKKEK